jgi:hypothetical protein
VHPTRLWQKMQQQPLCAGALFESVNLPAQFEVEYQVVAVAASGREPLPPPLQ